MANGILTRLSDAQIQTVRGRWFRDTSFLGYPDAERDARLSDWFDQLLVRPDWFNPATASKATVIIGRKGAGKSAVRVAGMRERDSDPHTLCIEASADELASLHAAKLSEASSRGFGAVNDWMRIFADLIVRHVARDLSGKLLVSDDDVAVRAWAKIEGVSERDFGERLVDVIKTLVPWAKQVAGEGAEIKAMTDARAARIMGATSFSLYIDDFDNLQENGDQANLRLIRDAVEAADRITHHNGGAEVHLLMRQDLWLRLCPGWHYADKVAGVVPLNWEQDDLRKWAERRLRRAVAIALEVDVNLVRVRFDELWEYSSLMRFCCETINPVLRFIIWLGAPCTRPAA